MVNEQHRKGQKKATNRSNKLINTNTGDNNDLKFFYTYRL